ncbi:Rrf2 family transcriptional regulator [PVC group bacterium]|nr:Rrf2 family transcriptional regulator [PVC group bacterium]
MLLIHKKLEYAVIVLKFLHKLYPGERATAKEISEHYKMPFDSTSRVMQLMKDGHLLKSEQGMKGGYSIATDLNHVSLLGLMECVLGPVEITKCLNKEYGNCELTCQCSIIPSMIYLNEKILSLYKTITLYELMTIENKQESQKIKSEYLKRNTEKIHGLV